MRKPDYPKWMLDDPRINFAISKRSDRLGVNHLGLQVDTGEELVAMRGVLEQADAGMIKEVGAKCCYAKSDKYWVTDPQGVAWETFHSLGSVLAYGEDSHAAAPESSRPASCCASTY